MLASARSNDLVVFESGAHDFGLPHRRAYKQLRAACTKPEAPCSAAYRATLAPGASWALPADLAVFVLAGDVSEPGGAAVRPAGTLPRGGAARAGAVVLECSHMCMCGRGVRQPEASTTTSAAVGALCEPCWSTEFYGHLARPAGRL